MKFNRYLPRETRELLERQYKEYIKNTPITKKEQRAVREWVKDGHSVYESDDCYWQCGYAPVEYLTVWRDKEYMRSHTKGMTSDERRKFVMDHYGLDEIPDTDLMLLIDELEYMIGDRSIDDIEELPFM